MISSPGISIIICCYNSRRYLPKTLLSLSKQHSNKDIPVEIIVVDNASTDGTSDVAQTAWSKLASSMPFILVEEPRSGLIYARQKGINQAKYNYLLFCDDDNFLNEHYVETAFNIMEKDPTIAALGGQGFPEFETEPQEWFNKLNIQYATGKQANQSGPVPYNMSYVYGAGSIYRKDVLQSLYNKGFVSYLTGRKGKKLLASEDVELGYALTLFGYKIWFDERLTFIHIIPKKRLIWSYILKDYYGRGYSNALLKPYQNILYPTKENRSYWKYFFSLAKQIIKEIFTLSYYWFTNRRRNLLLNIYNHSGELVSLLRNRLTINQISTNLKNAAWISLSTSTRNKT